MISDEVLANYKATGTRLAEPKEAPGFRGRSRSSASGVSGAASGRRSFRAGGASFSASGASGGSPEVQERVTIAKPPKDVRKEKVYILVKEPDNTEVLEAIKRVCDRNLGMQDIILVLQDGEEKKALKMPFRVEGGETFLKEMGEVVGEDAVKIV